MRKAVLSAVVIALVLSGCSRGAEQTLLDPDAPRLKAKEFCEQLYAAMTARATPTKDPAAVKQQWEESLALQLRILSQAPREIGRAAEGFAQYLVDLGEILQDKGYEPGIDTQSPEYNAAYEKHGAAVEALGNFCGFE